MSEELKKEVETAVEELLDDELDQVSGGAGLRHTKKEQTVDISEDTLRKI